MNSGGKKLLLLLLLLNVFVNAPLCRRMTGVVGCSEQPNTAAGRTPNGGRIYSVALIMRSGDKNIIPRCQVS
jgi:hypothetical protein